MDIKKNYGGRTYSRYVITNSVFASDMYATRGETADMPLSAADDYNKRR